MPYPEEYKARAKRYNVKVVYNINHYQHIRSLICGYFCIYFFSGIGSTLGKMALEGVTMHAIPWLGKKKKQ